MIVHSQQIDLPLFSTPHIELHACQSLHNASALVLTPEDACKVEIIEYVLNFNLPLFVVFEREDSLVPSPIAHSSFISLMAPLTAKDFSRIQTAANHYDLAVLPTFTRRVAEFASKSRSSFACPGHQGGGCLDLSPVGVRFKKLLGEHIFKLDVPHAAPELGDVLGHEGPVHSAEILAARVFGADETYFVLNGTSTANKIVTSALIASGDLVLMDRNNHKSVFLGALVLSGGIPIYLDNHRDDLGVLGGYIAGALDEKSLRQRITKIDPIKALKPRPFRVAIVQHSTCDGVVLDAGSLVRKIGHLCDYILFDSAWLGYEPFIESLIDKSPLNLTLSPDDPGIIVTQSVHKQMSGLSQTSQIHKKDSHLKGQPRHCSTEAFNSSFMLHSSTSPSYPLFMSLEVNAAIHANGQGELMWKSAVVSASLLRSEVENRCSIIKPYIGGRIVDARLSQEDNYQSFYSDPFRPLTPSASADHCPAIEDRLHYVDPCKVIFTSKRIDAESTSSDASIPAPVIAHYLRECNFTPEKSDFYNFTILISPSTNRVDIFRMAERLEFLEQLINSNASVLDALPRLAAAEPRYRGLSLRELCKSISDLYLHHEVEKLQTRIFSAQSTTQTDISPYQANQHLVHGKYGMCPVRDAVGKVAVEGVVPYPPGIMCVAPGERFTPDVIRYLLAIEDLTAKYPEFAPHIQGVHQAAISPSMVVLVLE